MKKLAIVIPHFNGKEILFNCITSLYSSSTTDFNIYLVDNGSTDDSIQMVQTKFQEVVVINSEINLGYAGGCNLGAKRSKEPYILFYNNDTELEENALELMLKQIENDPKIGALQPKLISYHDKTKYDYSGACGGEMDYLGYPFARGRIFDTIEENKNQYDDHDKNIFWASGTALMLRRNAIDDVGLLDHDFFAHMEEIDLCWRMHQRNWSVQVCTSAIVYHYSGYTLNAMNPHKMFLNHRNNLYMLYKNLPDKVFYGRFTKRILLEIFTFIISLIKLDFNRAKSVFKALISFFLTKKLFKNKRKEIQSKRINDDIPVYESSIVRSYFINGLKKYSQL